MTSTAVSAEDLKMTDIGPLPSQWKVVKLGVVAKLIMGQSPPGNTYNESGEGVPFLQGKAEFGNIAPRNIKYTTRPQKIAPRGSVLISVRAPVGDVNVADIDYCIGRGLASLSMHEGDNTFLFYMLSHRKEDIETEGTGSTFKAINKSKLQAFPFAFPPLPEQKKIAYVLSTVQTAIEKTEAAIKAARELKKSLIKYLFTYGPVSMDEVKNVSLKETEIGMVPEEWDVIRLGEVITFSSKPRDLNLSAHDKVPFVPMEYIPDERTDISRYQMKKPEEIRSGTFFFKGDLLVAKITPSFENGKQCIANNLPSDFAYATTEVWPLHETKRADLLYLFYYLKRKDVRADIAGKMEGSTGRQRVPRRVLQSLYIPLPPLQIQKQIAHILSIVDREIEPKENKKEALKALFNTLLKNLMTGKIRVNNLEVPV